jgi:serine/threonine-protein kinase RsbT
VAPNIVAPQGGAGSIRAVNAAPLCSQHTVPIASESDIVTARLLGRTLSSQLGFSPTDATLVATAISELAQNIVLYAKIGTITIQALHENGKVGIQIAAHDDGHGIADVARAVTGGYSTSGSLGLGLCGVRQLVDQFEIVSRVGSGTRVVVTKWKA